MEPELVKPAVAPPVATDAVRGYARATVDDFLAAAGDERARLEAALTEAKERQAKSRSVIGMHRVMLSMLLEAQEELHTRRREAEAAAEETLRRADLEADRILAAAQAAPVIVHEPAFVSGIASPPAPEVVAAADPAVTSIEPPTAHGDALVIDLPHEHRNESESHGGNGAAEHRLPVFTAAGAARSRDGSSEEFFMFLRGALTDDEPLGPR